MSSWPPFFVLFASSANNIIPAQVPHVGLRRTFTNSRKGSNSPLRSAIRDIDVDSPPGRIRASHCSSSSAVLASVKTKDIGLSRFRVEEAWRSSCRCSEKAPWRAKHELSAQVQSETREHEIAQREDKLPRTPIVILVILVETVILPNDRV